jgi:hypothetical protein
MRAMLTLAGLEFRETHDSPVAVAADFLAILGFFFAMRSCENATAPPQPGLTKTVDLLGVIFLLDKDHRETPQDHPGISLAAWVTLLFANQKNRNKNPRRTQKRTGDPVLCPVCRAASPIEGIRRFVVGFLGSATINAHTHQSCQGLVTLQLASGFLWSQLQHTCSTLGGKQVFGFDKMDIGTKSIWPGAAMGLLFLANHSTERIMLMGRWKSQAFLVCICPQVIEWTNNMSRDMIPHDSHTDASGFDMADPNVARVPPRRFNGPDNSLITPSFHLDH